MLTRSAGARSRTNFPNVAVNPSARQLIQLTLITKSDRILERTDIKPKYLELEITETAIMLNFDITYNV